MTEPQRDPLREALEKQLRWIREAILPYFMAANAPDHVMAALGLAEQSAVAALAAPPEPLPAPAEPSVAAIEAALNVLDCDTEPVSESGETAWMGAQTHMGDIRLVARVLRAAYRVDFPAHHLGEPHL